MIKKYAYIISTLTIVCLIAYGSITVYKFIQKLQHQLIETQNKYEELQKIVNIQKQDLLSQRQLYKKLKQENKELYKKIKKYKLKINNLTQITITYKKQIVDLQSQVIHQDTFDKVNFNYSFDTADVDGFISANKIIGVPKIHLELTPKPQHVTIVDTNTGTIVDSSHGTVSNINTSSSKEYHLEIFAGINTLGNITFGAFKKNIGIQIQYGTHNSIGILYRRQW